MTDNERDPRTDPRPGDVVKSDLGNEYIVTSIVSDVVHYSIKTSSFMRKWYWDEVMKDAEIIKRGE